MQLAIIGGGPAGLRASEIALAGGASVTLWDAKPSVGRKLLVAGRGGLNLTKAEPLDAFVQNYLSTDLPPDFWKETLHQFDPDALRLWAAQLGIETFVASTRRVYPVEMKAAPLLRRWVQRLRSSGVQFQMNHQWTGITPDAAAWRLHFQCDGKPVEATAQGVILALGGASWPETGSTGQWPLALQHHGIECRPWLPANCGWELPWPDELKSFEGHPLKNVAAQAGSVSARGELMLTRYGFEGGLLYQLGPSLRTLPRAVLHLDLKPDLSIERLLAKLGPVRSSLLTEAAQRWRLTPCAAALLRWKAPPESHQSGAALARAVKSLPIELHRPRPIAEAISSAGGLSWKEVDRRLMLRKLPGVFAAGEMLDWEAPTGGYLLQGCFATASLAAQSALDWLQSATTAPVTPSP